MDRKECMQILSENMNVTALGRPKHRRQDNIKMDIRLVI
jgi:hypothetical protein